MKFQKGKIGKKIFQIAVYVFAIIGLVFTIVYLGMQVGAFNVKGSNAQRNASLGITPIATQAASVQDCVDTTLKTCDWNQTVEWGVLKAAFAKDASVIADVSTKTGVSPRMIVATVMPEQTRYFTSNRESFKKYFEPLKILSSLSKFSLGVSGVKEDTAKQIETYANDPTSPFYPGQDMAALIAYPPDANHDQVLYDRLTDAHNHYFSYLYTALYIKEIETEWGNAGFDISQSPEAVVTLFNIGFKESMPHANPQAAGSIITLGGKKYSYGDLGTLMYNSGELPQFAK